MPICQGKRGDRGLACFNALYRCLKCGNIGCEQPDCTRKGFDSGKCIHCGSKEKKLIA